VCGGYLDGCDFAIRGEKMPLSQEQLEKLHLVEIKELDEASRFSFKVHCSCGVEGLFLTKEQAEGYKHYHLENKKVAPY
jgi:hypothetical protein